MGARINFFIRETENSEICAVLYSNSRHDQVDAESIFRTEAGLAIGPNDLIKRLLSYQYPAGKDTEQEGNVFNFDSRSCNHEQRLDVYWRYDNPHGKIDAVIDCMQPKSNRNLKFSLRDQSDQPHESTKGSIALNEIGFTVSLDGFTDNVSFDDKGIVLAMEQYEGSVRVLVFADINSEAPTHTIPLEGARNEKRCDL